MVLDLGFHPLADSFLKKEDLQKPEVTYPLRVLLCESCGHVMSSYRVPPKDRYQAGDYSYDSSNSKVSITHFEEMAKSIGEMVCVSEKDLVVDVGGNVGTLLQEFKKCWGTQVLNVDPSKNIAALSIKNGVETIQDFFNERAVEEIVKRCGAKVITATNVFNHVDDIDLFMSHIKKALVPGGFFVCEVPYVLHLIEKVAFDTIYLEHVSYFAVKPLASFFRKVGFTIVEILESEYMGGSIRVTVQLGEGSEASSVATYIKKEEEANIYSPQTYHAMENKMKDFKRDLRAQLIEVKKNNGVVIGIGAATKGNTLLNYCGIDRDLLSFITDASVLKVGKYTPGSHIPILHDDAITHEVRYALILPWNIAAFLKEKLAPKYPQITFITPHM